MRAIAKPQYNSETVYNDCVNNVSDDKLKSKLQAITDSIVNAANDYDDKAKVGELFIITSTDYEDEDVVLNNVNKKELTNLYTQQMVGKTKVSRKIYDELLSSAPLGKCPFCGFGQASTLDHYLPKAKYPLFSVLPFNLIPTCRDCNLGVKKEKSADTAEQQVIHPYYDHDLLTEQWLFAKVKEEVNPDTILIEFYVKPPAHWAEISKQRVKTHFKDFEFSKRFAIEAADELSSLNYLLGINVKQHFKSIAEAEYTKHKNSWKTAMYQALAASDWYCSLVTNSSYLCYEKIFG